MVGDVGGFGDGAVDADYIGHDGAGHEGGREVGDDVDGDCAIGVDLTGVDHGGEGAERSFADLAGEEEEVEGELAFGWAGGPRRATRSGSAASASRWTGTGFEWGWAGG